MKKFLLAGSLLVGMSSLSLAQSQISFETSEGYTLGDIDGQQGWIYWGYLDPNTGVVTSTTSTQGANSLHFISNGYTDEGGVEKAVTGYDKTLYSFDYKIEDLNGSDYEMAVWDNDYLYVAAFHINYSSGNLQVYNGGMGFENTSINLSPGVWYNLQMLVDMTNKTVEYFINNTSLGTKAIQSNAAGFNIIDFYYDDWDTGFTVDNINIQNAALLATHEVTAVKQFNVYPNPTTDFVTIKTEAKINSVEVLDAAGKIVLKDTSGNEKVQMSALATGSYILKVHTSKGVLTNKIIKK